MKKIKIGIIILLIMIVILIILIKILTNKEDNNIVNEDKIIEDEQSMGIGEFSSDKVLEVSTSEWMQIGRCIDSYLDIINKNNSAYFGTDQNGNYTKIFTEEEIKQRIYDVISQNFLNNNNITLENIYDYIQTVEEDQSFITLKIRKIVNDDLNQYVVKGFTQTQDEFKEEKTYIVNFNLKEGAFSIEPITNTDNIETIEVKNTEVIRNNSNMIPNVLASAENITKEYFNMLKRMLLVAPEYAYTYLDDEYKEKRFGSYEKFLEYINENYNNIYTLVLSKYQVNTYEDYIEYVCVDTKGNYYLFKEASIMEDTYTIKSETYIENYNTLKDPEKASVNVDIFIQMINTKDYHHAYEVLAEGFKNNYFPTEEDFKNYMKKNFYDYNVLKINTSTNEGTVYIFKSTLTNGGNTETENQNKTFNVLLGEGTDFTISFNV